MGSDGAPVPSEALRREVRRARPYDRERRELVLFGGLVGRLPNAETWVRRDGDWLERGVSGPPARNVHGMAYDPKRKRVVIYGGIGDSERMDDLWEWDGASWTEVLRDSAR